MSSRQTPAVAVVLGARNLGGTIARSLLAAGWRVAIVARTQADLKPLEQAGALAICADAGDPARLQATLTEAAGALGPLDLIVNAVSAARPPGDGSGFGGGNVAAATIAGFDAWTVAVARQAFVFLTSGARALAGHGGTLVQITGAPARRADPTRGLLAAGQAATRALVHAAAQELRASGTHVVLLIVDGVIASPKTAPMAAGRPKDALVRQDDVAQAVRHLAEQSACGLTHELILTAAADRWLP
jgi:NAD(P)-dependent dehydrogenase (short-subunit alcohol dehydrogenase family)